MTHLTLLMVGLLTAAADKAAPIPGGPCTGREDVLAIHGKWTPRTDIPGGTNIPASMVPDVTARIDKIGQVFRAAYPEPRGMEAAAYRDLNATPLLPQGPFAYSYRSMYTPWSCATKVHKWQLGGETATWAYAFVNQLTWFSEPQKNLQVAGQPTFLLWKRVGSLRGLPAYEGIHNQTSNTGQTFSRAILVTRPNRSPLRPVTRKEFLEAYSAMIEAEISTMVGQVERSGLDPAKKTTAIQQRKDQMLKLQGTAAARLSRMSPSEAAQPAFLTPANLVQFKDFTAEAQGGRALVRLDRSYFEETTARYAPQFVVVYWRWQKGAASENFRNEFERRFDPNAIVPLLGH
jgi:hypothetical protein